MGFVFNLAPPEPGDGFPGQLPLKTHWNGAIGDRVRQVRDSCNRLGAVGLEVLGANIGPSADAERRLPACLKAGVKNSAERVRVLLRSIEGGVALV